MAKQNDYSPWILLAASLLLLAGGWLMSSFPLLILVAYAPLLALTNRANDSQMVWEKMEWVLAGLIFSFFAARGFDTSSLVSSFVYGIIFTLPFVGHIWVHQVLGKKAGKITLIFFWLALEYILVKLNPEGSIYLADAIRRQPDWYAWNIHTGYIGSSAWILLANLAVYQVVLSDQAFRWPWILLGAIVLIGPAVYGYSLSNAVLSRGDMVNLYKGSTESIDSVYLARGEWLSRTCAWLSTLILLFTFVKSQTGKR